VPAREDLATPESWSKPISTRGAIEAMPEGCIAVADAMGVTDAGIFGDILCARIARSGRDGARHRRRGARRRGRARDGLAGVVPGRPRRRLGRRPHVRELGEPIGCGGVAVFPDDWVVVDDDGAVLIPAAIIDEIVADAPEQERLEAWIMEEVEKGRFASGAVSAECREQGALRKIQELERLNRRDRKTQRKD
jgi:regulator of RNase E activity RraA